MNSVKLTIYTAIFLVSLAPFGYVKAANQINITAYVINKDGSALPDGDYKVRFAVYTKNRDTVDPYPSNSDSAIWQEEQTVNIYGGVMSAYLAAEKSFPENLDFSTGDYYLGIRIGEDSEMAPRKKLGAALSAINSSFLQGKTIGNKIGDIPEITSKGLDSTILAKINEVGTVSTGTWEADTIDDDYIADDLTDKTYNGLDINTSGGRTLTISEDVTLDQNLAVSSSPEFATLTLTDALYLTETTAPSDTTNYLYNVGGNLYWDGTNLSASVGTTYSAGDDLDLTGTAFSLQSTLDYVSTINLAGTGTLNGLDAIDNTTKVTLQSALNLSGTNTGDNAVNSLYSGLVTNAAHTGDATGDTVLTVVKINGTSLSGLATGILKNTTGTGVPSIAIAGDFPTLNQNTTGNAATVTNGVYSTGTYSDPTWLSAIAGTKINSNISYNAANVTGTVSIANGGTGQTSAQAARNALLPSQETNANKFLQTDGTDTTWQNILWSQLNAPATNLSLTMQNYTTTFTYGDATGTTNLFNITDSINNTGTGYLVNITTANPSLLSPLSVSAGNGVFPAIAVNSSGKVGIGWTNPASQLTVVGGATFGAVYSLYSLTDGIVAIENNLGIGTTNPKGKADIGGVTTNLGTLGILSDTNHKALNIEENSGGEAWQVGVNAYGDLIFMDSNAAASAASVTFQDGGNVGIGVTNPTAKLEIGGTAGTDGIKFPDGTTQTTAPCGSVIYDADNNAYGSIPVGTQCWMSSNLRVGTKLASGSTMPSDNGIIEKWCYDNSDTNCAEDGGFYHWDEAMQYSTTPGARGICPIGWHIPTDAEQYTLENYLKDTGATCNASRSDWDCTTAGTKLKSGIMNVALAGYRSTDGSFHGRASYAYVWSSSESGGSAWSRYLNSGYATVYRFTNAKAYGFSVRCLKD